MSLTTRPVAAALDLIVPGTVTTRPIPIAERARETMAASEKRGTPENIDTPDDPVTRKKARRQPVPTLHAGALPPAPEPRRPATLALAPTMAPTMACNPAGAAPQGANLSTAALATVAPEASGSTGPAAQGVNQAAQLTQGAREGQQGQIPQHTNAATVSAATSVSSAAARVSIADTAVAGATVMTTTLPQQPSGAVADPRDDRAGTDTLSVTPPPGSTGMPPGHRQGEHVAHQAEAPQGSPRPASVPMSVPPAQTLLNAHAAAPGSFSYAFRWDGGHEVVTGSIYTLHASVDHSPSLVATHVAGSMRALDVIAANAPLSAQVEFHDDGHRQTSSDERRQHASSHDHEDELT